MRDLNSKLISASSTNYISTYNSIIQSSKNRYKDKNKQIQNNGKSVNHINLQFMFDLSKSIVVKAGGSINENFDGNNINRALIKPHKQLHICAFLISMHALGLNNQLTKWLQRTFSSYVSWVQKVADDIGAPSINCLITSWKGYLTPNEVMSIICSSTAPSKISDTALLKAKAKLALSILSESQALRLIDIRQAIQLCKDQSEEMLIQALISIQNSFKNGGLSSDILFETAKHWYQLYLDYNSKESTKLNSNSKRKLIHQQQQQVNPCVYPFAADAFNNLNGYHLNDATQTNNQVNRIHSQLMLHSQAVNHMIPPPPPHHFNYPIYYPSFVYPPPPHQVNPNLPPNLAAPPHNLQLPPPPPPNFNSLPLPPLNNFNLHHMVPPMFKNFPPPITNLQQLQNASPQFNSKQQQQQQAQLHQNFLLSQRFMNGRNLYANNSLKQNQQSPLLPFNPYQASFQHSIQQHHQQAKTDTYLFNAYNLGIMALDALPRKGSSDDRSTNSRFDLNPHYYDEIIWLAEISFKLTPLQHQEFLSHVIKSVSSPFILYDLVMTIEENLSANPFINHPSRNLFKQLINCGQHA